MGFKTLSIITEKSIREILSFQDLGKREIYFYDDEVTQTIST
jgi:hypothetical protein